MRLKTLEIKGFKSFANETVVHFGENVIGIVGPNGSGKSNIVDAIRWVLGEQKSKELRLDKMTSVIFNGTKKRKASPMAQVSLTFENTKNVIATEYQTVTVTRILYQSGESEYRLNNVSCRLKDITNLFMDTGVGSNSYAIIALGMVDDLLSDREQSRRAMLEQAAGVSKYKVRKHETLQKLESTTADLDRVEDLLHEIVGNLAALEKQAKRAEKYLELKLQYREQSLELAVCRIANYKTDYKVLAARVDAEEDKLRQTEAEEVKTEAALAQIRAANIDKEQVLAERQRDLNVLVGRIRNAENDKKMLAQQQLFAKQNAQKADEQIKSAEGRIAKLNEEVAYYESEIGQEKRVEARLELQLADAETQLQQVRQSHSSLKSDLDTFLKSQQTLDRQVLELEKQRAINQNQVENAQRDIVNGEQTLQQRADEMTDIREMLAKYDTQEREQEAQVTQLESQETTRQADLKLTEQRIEDIAKRQADANRRLDSRRNEYKLTKSLVENLEGFPESIKYLSNPKNWQRNAPLLSDLVYCKPEYRVAIENYLEPFLNYYVVDDLAEAMQAVDLLKKNQKGKANFFTLDAFEGHQSDLALVNFASAATEFIEVDAKYRGLCYWLLDNVFIVSGETMPEDTKNFPSAIFLTQSGSIAKRHKSLSGGSVGLFEGKRIGRKKNIEILARDIADLETETAGLTSEVQAQRAHLQELRAKDLQPAIRQARDARYLTAQHKSGANARLENFERFAAESRERIAQAQTRITTLEAQNIGIGTQLDAFHQQSRDAQNQISSTDQSHRQVADLMSQLSAKFNESNVAFIRQQNKVSTLQQDLTFRRRQAEENSLTLGNAQRTLAQTTQEVDQISTQIGQLDQDLQTGYSQRKDRETLLTEAEQAYYQAKNAIQELDDKLRNINRSLHQQQVGLQQTKDAFNNIKLSLAGIGERLKVEFNMSVNDLINKEPNPNADPEALEGSVGRLKSRLDNYGEVNPLAVEAYREMKARHDTIAEQRDDILKAKESLLETIREIEITATKQFMDAFATIREHFINVFRSLFTDEDTCDLVLVDPNRPLESHINIIAKPKGKRPQSISQLSGGEKTLTATALLFALYLFKPAPFCIFDEVDAPLDDSNIEKFNRIIQKFSADSQFIIVTHNKLTMAAVDVIYGVHMPEQGVSAVTPVDFRDLKHEANMTALN